MAANFKNFLKEYRKKTGSSSIIESRYGEPSYWISTGSWALNRICSGHLKKGVPSGRITILAGESSCVPESTRVRILHKRYSYIVK